MKCVKYKGGKITRLKDDLAAKAVEEGASYCSKVEWKNATREGGYKPGKGKPQPSKKQLRRQKKSQANS